MPTYRFPDYRTVTDWATYQEWLFDFEAAKSLYEAELLERALAMAKELHDAADAHKEKAQAFLAYQSKRKPQ